MHCFALYCKSLNISQSNKLKPRMLSEITVLEKMTQDAFWWVDCQKKKATFLFELLASV